MPKQVLTIGALAAIFVTAVILNLSFLDVIALPELRDSLGRTLTVIAVTTVAIVLMVTITRISRQPGNTDQPPKP